MAHARRHHGPAVLCGRHWPRLGSDGKYHAAYYDYAVPQVGASFDRGDATFVTAEHVPTAAGGRILRRPFDAATGRLKPTAYWPATGEPWLLNEQPRERVTVHVPWTPLTGRP